MWLTGAELEQIRQAIERLGLHVRAVWRDTDGVLHFDVIVEERAHG